MQGTLRMRRVMTGPEGIRCMCLISLYPFCEQICISEGFVHALNIGTHTLRCLAEYGADESGCDYVLHGVSGGAIIYYDDPVLPSGQY